MGKNRPRPKDQIVFATQSTHKLLAGISQASQVLVQDSQTRKLDAHLFNEAYLMHSSTSPQYAIIASCDVSAAMMEAPGGRALVEESIAESLDFRRAMRKVDGEFGKDWWFKVWGPEKLAAEGIGTSADWMLKANAKWHGFGDLADGFNLLDPIKCTVITPGLDMSGKFAKTGIPAAIVTKFLVEHGVVVEKTGLYSFFIMFTIGITKGRWNTLRHRAAAVQGRLRPQPADVEDHAGVLRRAPALRAGRPARPVAADPRVLRQGRHRAARHRHVLVGPAAGDEAERRVRLHRAPQRPSGWRSTSSKGASRPRS